MSEATVLDRHRNGRDRKLAKWITGQSETECRLVLLFSFDEEVHQVGDWSNTEDADALAEDVLELAQDTCDEIGRPLHGHLRWRNEDGEYTGRRRVLRMKPANPSHFEFEGTNLDQARQAQTHMEAMTRVFVGSLNDMMQTMQAAMSTQSEMNDRIAERLGASEQRETEAKEALAQLREELTSARQELAHAEEGATDERTERLLQLAEKCATPYLMKMAASDMKPKN